MTSYLRSRIIVACLSVVPLIGCSDPTAPLPREGAPDELRFSFGGFAIGDVTLELQDSSVAMWGWTPGATIDTVRVVPNEEAWREFWSAAERAGVRRWRSRYFAEGVIDGNGWSFRLVAGDFALESTGSNAYPDALGRERELIMTDEFRLLRTALGKLVGEEL